MEAASAFLHSQLAQEMGGEGSVSTDASFRERLTEVIDPSLARNAAAPNGGSPTLIERPPRSERRGPPMAGWIGDFSANASDFVRSRGSGGGTAIRPDKAWYKVDSSSESIQGGGAKGDGNTNESNNTTGDETGDNSGSNWNFAKIINKGSMTSGSDLNTTSKSESRVSDTDSGVSSGVDSSSRLSNVPGPGSRSGSSVASEDIYTSAAALSPESPPDEKGEGRSRLPPSEETNWR
jgi:hypothetical protein